MNELEWLTSNDPTRMLQFLGALARDRKVRLLTIGCFRRSCGAAAKRKEPSLDLLELHADGRISNRKAKEAAKTAFYFNLHERVFTESPALRLALSCIEDFAATADYVEDTASQHFFDAERTAQARLIRCVFGNPFRSVPLLPYWVAWNDGAIRKMAHAIYEGRAFDHMPLLVDALDDCGCTSDAILAHCREPGEHVRGCWVIDLLLGKK